MHRAKQAGHMTCTRPQAERQIPLATRASSTHDPYPLHRALRVANHLRVCNAAVGEHFRSDIVGLAGTSALIEIGANR